MFPRIKKIQSNGKTYEYLVISESFYKPGKGSTTRDVANLGNVKSFKEKDIQKLIDGLIRLFQIEKYCSTDGIEMIESLEHGSIIFWQKLWDKLGLSKLIKDQIKLKDIRIKLAVEKYIEIMTLNRCIAPLSKLGVTRWVERTCYKEMKGFSNLSFDVTLFYRSMDYLLSIKEEIESELYEQLKNLFSINVKMTFYDITSTYFYSESCPLSAHGYSRDNRPDKVQIIVGVVTSYEGYPIKHYVFEGNTKDETTVKEVIKELKEKYNIEETTFVGDRGMITKLNLDKIVEKGYGYIMGVKTHQDEVCQMILSKSILKEKDFEEYKKLKIQEKRETVKDFLKWKSKEILKRSEVSIKEENISNLEDKIDKLTNKDQVDYREYKKIYLEISPDLESKEYRYLYKIIERYEGKYEEEYRYIICLNDERKALLKKRRDEYILRFSKELDSLFSKKKKNMNSVEVEKSLNKIFEGYKGKYRKFFRIIRDKETNIALSYQINKEELEEAKRLDGIFVLTTSRKEIEKNKVVDSYKNLQEVEILFDDFKNFVDVRPIRHWLDDRVRAHVFICILALLLKRIFEINYLQDKSLTEPLEEISKSKLIKYKIKFSEKEERSKEILKVTTTNPLQKKYFNMIGINYPENLTKFI